MQICHGNRSQSGMTTSMGLYAYERRNGYGDVYNVVHYAVHQQKCSKSYTTGAQVTEDRV